MSKDESNRKKTKTKKRKSKTFVLSMVFLLAIIASGVFLLIHFYMPNFKTSSLYEHFANLDSNKIYVILEDKRIDLDNYPMEKDNELYIPVDFVKEYIDKYIFWDPVVEKLTITTANKVMRMQTEDLNYYINNDEFKLNLPVYNIDEVAYMPSVLLEELYNIKIDYNEEYKNIIIDYNDKEKTTAVIKKDNLPLRYEANIKSPIEEKLPENELVFVYEEEEFFTKVRTAKGLIGYIRTDEIGDLTKVDPIFREPIKAPELKNKIDGKINLVWDQILTPAGNLTANKKTVVKGVNVLSPTWFKFDPSNLDGSLLNIADESYVRFAHENNYQVWALFNDFASENINFTSSVLSNTEYREYVIKQLVSFVSLYNLDGINIDFEHINVGDEVIYLQFLRELNPFLKEQGVILSVDMYVPLYTKHYNRLEVGKVVDYVCVMAYDEHTGSRKGPGASYGFVEQGIVDTLDEVPADKIIMGIPNYSRIWKNGVRFAEYGKSLTYKTFEEKDVKFKWLEEYKLYYGSYTELENGSEVTYEVWVEDERALEEKLLIFEQYNLAGVATWVRDLGYDEYYEIIDNKLKSMDN